MMTGMPWCHMALVIEHELAIWSKSDGRIIDIAVRSIGPVFWRRGWIFIGIEIEPSFVVSYWPFSGS
jgi:hypothetical protein